MARADSSAASMLAVAALAVPIGLSAQDVTKTLGPGFYQIAVGSEALFAWRINTANGTTSYCAAPSDPTSKAPVCSPWSAGVIKEPR